MLSNVTGITLQQSGIRCPRLMATLPFLQTNVITELLARELRGVARRLSCGIHFFTFLRSGPTSAFQQIESEAAGHCEV